MRAVIPKAVKEMPIIVLCWPIVNIKENQMNSHNKFAFFSVTRVLLVGWPVFFSVFFNFVQCRDCFSVRFAFRYFRTY